MKLQPKHTDTEPKTADEYRQVADAHAQELKGFWKRFAVSGLFVIAVVVIIFASLAWFASNRSVDASTSAISAKAARYSISGASGNDAKAGVYDTQFSTNDSLNVSATYNLNNYTNGSLRPGSYGELQVTVTPVAGDVRNITLTIERDIKQRSTADTSVSAETLQNLFRGHVLLFQSRGEDGYYSNPILNDALTIESSKFCEEGSSLTTKPVTLTLYWVWPSQFSSYVLTGQINYNKNLFASTKSEGYAKLLEDINGSENWARYFPEKPSVTVKSDMSSADLEVCTEAYNAGDELLGTNAEYLQIRFVGTEGAN